MTPKFIISTCLFFTFFIPSGVLSEDSGLLKNESSKKEEKRIFQAELYVALCKDCLDDLIAELKETRGVLKAEVKVVTSNDEKYGMLKVNYLSPRATRTILVEVIRFRDLYPSAISDKPAENNEHR